jgi:hypothetical protein
VVDRGGIVVEILQTAYLLEANQSQLDSWITSHDLNVTALIDRDPDPEPETYGALGIREQTFIVDLATMQIVWQKNGSVAGIGDSSARTGIDQILTMLP